MNETKVYIWRLASLLYDNGTRMSGEELAQHLNRNRFHTTYGTEYKGKRGTYRLIHETWRWLEKDLCLKLEAKKVAKAFVKPNGKYAYK